jgi:dihydroorotate dehydrogenase
MLAAAVDEDGELDFFGAAEIHQLVERGPDGAAGVEHVVDEDDYFAFDIFAQLGSVHDRICPDGREVVAIERDVDDAVNRANAFESLNFVDDPFGKRNAAPPDADYVELDRTVVFLDYLRSQPRNGPFNAGAVHYSRFLHKRVFVDYGRVAFVCHSLQIVAESRGKFKEDWLGLGSALGFLYYSVVTMSRLFEKMLRPVLFRLDAETAHEAAMKFLQRGLGNTAAQRIAYHEYGYEYPFEIERFGLKFKNPLGVAAGFDKNGRVVNQLASLGFGFVEVGTVTLRPQPGNEKPRMFRLPADNALINRLGFNNEGAKAVAERLSRLERKCVVGVNIGKNKDVPNEEAVENYLATFDLVHAVADYVAVNISSPNTPNLRDLQRAENLGELLGALQERNRELGAKPLLVKIAPDLEDPEVEAVVDVCCRHEVAGMIATNTTVAREGLKTPDVSDFGAGGLSGRPLAARSAEVISKVYGFSKGTMPIIGVGGIFNAQDAFDKIAAGACLLQAYTGFIYGGPSFAYDINTGLAELLTRNGFQTFDEAVGSGAG